MSLLSVNKVGKSFSSYRSELHRFARWFSVPTKPCEEHWVLRDINFDIRAGEAIGIIGSNGAGKSTLLKMISGTMQPTEGNIQVNGRIAAILELGMGFNPELTGRHNVFHAAGLMGFNAEQIQQAMPDIEAFAEIGEYFDEPVRTYSSGMQMRVAFSVATSGCPDLLIVDEALSVGDAYFQHKCFERLKKYREKGGGLLFVSHDIKAIKNICDRTILLSDGEKAFDGHPEDAFNYYNALLAQQHPEPCLLEERGQDVKTQGTRSGSGEMKITSVGLEAEGTKAAIIEQCKPFSVNISLVAMENIERWCVGIAIRDKFGNEIFGTNTTMLNRVLPALSKGNKLVVEYKFPSLIVGPGIYAISIALHDVDSHVIANYDWWDKAVVFEVCAAQKMQSSGLICMPVNCSIHQH